MPRSHKMMRWSWIASIYEYEYTRRSTAKTSSKQQSRWRPSGEFSWSLAACHTLICFSQSRVTIPRTSHVAATSKHSIQAIFVGWGKVESFYTPLRGARLLLTTWMCNQAIFSVLQIRYRAMPGKKFIHLTCCSYKSSLHKNKASKISLLQSCLLNVTQVLYLFDTCKKLIKVKLLQHATKLWPSVRRVLN